jgi:hypothetical protein
MTLSSISMPLACKPRLIFPVPKGEPLLGKFVVTPCVLLVDYLVPLESFHLSGAQYDTP